MSLPDTLTPEVLSLTPDTKLLLQQPKQIWGKLLPTIRCLCGFDLEKPTFFLGRDPSCDIVITADMFSVHRLSSFSKMHFKIEHVESVVYITDLSKNGTYLNGILIGKNRRHILQNDDEIAISFKTLRAFVFKSLQATNQTFLLPEGFRKKYEVSRSLGRGACGEVRLVFDKFTCQPYACKRICKSKGSRLLNMPEKIENEVEILRQLQHPFIITTKEIEETKEAFFIIMEYMEGGELSQLIFSAKKLTERQAKYLFYQIALAVQYLHHQNITHRDLKAENILLKTDTKDNNLIKISDFGLSKMIKDEAVMKSACGTPFFIAPEILDTTVFSYNQKVDVWSLGVMLYYMISQELPFRAPNTFALCKLILRGEFSLIAPLWGEISDNAKDLIRKMLTRNPADRLDINSVCDHPWFTEDLDVQTQVHNLLYTKYKTRVIESNDNELGSPVHLSKRIKFSKCTNY